MRWWAVRSVLVGVAVVVGAACAPDGPDVYTVAEPDAPPATRAPLPTTTSTLAPADVEESVVVVEPEPPATFEANGDVVEVRSLDNSFIQPDIEIVAGTEVTWINGGRNDHNVLPVDDSLTWGVDRDTFVPGTRYSHVFDTPGVYPYYCSIHGTQDVGMVGSVVVVAPS